MRKPTPIRVAAAVPAPHGGTARIGNEQGAVAVIVALVLTLLLGVMALTMDTGYLYLKKNQYQNGVEAAALAGVRQICEGDWEKVARQVAEANGLPNDAQSLTVETGFYDERDQYSQNLGEYKDYGPPPSGQYVNAVHVRLEQNLPSLTGMNDAATVVTEAVAYLKRIDIASLDPDGNIYLGHGSIWEDTVFWANGNILYPEAITRKGKNYQEPKFSSSILFSVGEVYSCSTHLVGGTTKQIEILWGSRTSQSNNNSHSKMESITEIRPVDEKTLDYWRKKADITYTPDQGGQDNVYYYNQNNEFYGIDPSETNNKRIIFFDSNNNNGKVIIGPQIPNAFPINVHIPNGDSITGLTFITNSPVIVQNVSSLIDKLYIGGEGKNQTIIISSQNIEIYNNGISYDGVIFRTGKDFIQKQGSGNSQHVRIIADLNIYGEETSTNFYSYDNTGIKDFSNNSLFGSPCLPGMARLGLLERGD